MQKIYRSKSFFKIHVLILVVLSFTFSAYSQITGTYQLTATGVNWESSTSWAYFNGTSWIPAPDYPGQNNVPAAVLVSAGVVNITSSLPFPLQNFTISGGTVNLPTTPNINLSISGFTISGGIFQVPNASSYTHNITLSGFFHKTGGTFTLRNTNNTRIANLYLNNATITGTSALNNIFGIECYGTNLWTNNQTCNMFGSLVNNNIFIATAGTLSFRSGIVGLHSITGAGSFTRLNDLNITIGNTQVQTTIPIICVSINISPSVNIFLRNFAPITTSGLSLNTAGGGIQNLSPIYMSNGSLVTYTQGSITNPLTVTAVNNRYDLQYTSLSSVSPGNEMPSDFNNNLGNLTIGNGTQPTVLNMTYPITISSGFMLRMFTNAPVGLVNTSHNIWMADNSNFTKTRGDIATFLGVSGFDSYNVNYNSGVVTSTGYELMPNSTSIKNINVNTNNTIVTVSSAVFTPGSTLNVMGNFTFNNNNTEFILAPSMNVSIAGNYVPNNNYSRFRYSGLGPNSVTIAGSFNAASSSNTQFLMTGTGMAHHLYLGNITNNLTSTTFFQTPGASSTIHFYANTFQNVPAILYQNIEISGNANKNLAGTATVTGSLILNGGGLGLQANNLFLTPSATVSGSTFSATNAVSITGNGALIYQVTAPGVYLYPISRGGLYAEAIITLSGFSGAGSMAVWANNTKLANQLDGSYSLNKFWNISTTGLSAIDAMVSLFYNNSEAVSSVAGSYIGAHYTGTTWSVDGVVLTVPGGAYINFERTSVPNLDQSYTAGPMYAFQGGTIYYSRQSGDWEDANSWSLVTFGGTPAPNHPTNFSNVAIGLSHNITVTAANKTITSVNIHSGSKLDVGAIININIYTLTGSGTISLSNVTSPVVTFNGLITTPGSAYEYYGGNLTLPVLNPVYSNLIIAGTGTKTLGTNTRILQNLIINPGVALQLSTFNFSVAGLTSISGTLTDNNGAGANQYGDFVVNTGGTYSNTTGMSANVNIIGNITVNGVWNMATPSTYIFGGNLEVNSGATFTSGAGHYTFTGSNATVSGTSTALAITNVIFNGNTTLNQSAITFTNITVLGTLNNNNFASMGTTNILLSGALNNNAVLYSTTALNGTGTLTQGTNATLYIGHNASAFTNFDFSAIGNTVSYYPNLFQTLPGVNFFNLSLSGGNTKTFTTNTTVAGFLSLSSGTTLSTGDFDMRVLGNTTLSGTITDPVAGGAGHYFNDVYFNGGTMGATALTNYFIQGNQLVIDGNATHARGVVSVSGHTYIAPGRTITFNNIADPKYFNGNVTIAGSWVASAAVNFLFNSDLIFDGTTTFTSNTGNYSFTGSNATLATTGTNPLLIANPRVHGTLINKLPNFTVANSLGGDGTFIQGIDATLSLAGYGFIGTLITTATGNNVTWYGAGTWNIPANQVFYNLNNTFTGILSPTGDLVVLNNLNIGSGSLNVPSPIKNISVLGLLRGAGTLNLSTNAHVVHLYGDNNSLGTLTPGTSSIINYARNGTQTIVGLTYNAISLTGTGNKEVNNTVTVAQNIFIPNGTSLNINPGATLRLANNVVINNEGNFNIVGNTTTGFATVTNNGAGNYKIVQTFIGATFGAQYANFLHLGNGGLSISDGNIHTVNNFSNTNFSNGTGSVYLNLDNVSFANFTANNVTFTGGPTFNVQRTGSPGGVITFNNAVGTFTGSTYTNPNPTDRVIWTYPQKTYYSNTASASFNNAAHWSRNPDGTGPNPTASEFTDGLTSFMVQASHTASLDRNLDLFSLSIAGSAFVENSVVRSFVFRQNINVMPGATFNIDAANCSGVLFDIRGDVYNNGTMNLSKSALCVTTVNFNGQLTKVFGSNPIITYHTNFNTIGLASSITTTHNRLYIKGITNINSGAIWVDGGLVHTIAGDWYVNGTGVFSTTGTLKFEESSNKLVQTAATFNHVEINKGYTSFVGNVNILGNLSVAPSATLATLATHTVSGHFTVPSGAVYQQTAGTMNLLGTNLQLINPTGAQFFALNFGNIGLKSITGSILANGQVTINANTTVAGELGSHTFNNNFLMNGVCSLTSSITMTNGNITRSISSSLELFAQLNINGNVSILPTAPATFLIFTHQNNLNVNSGTLTLAPSLISYSGNPTYAMSVANGATVAVNGTTSGHNFPSNYGSYNLGLTSNVNYYSTNNQSIYTTPNLIYGNLNILNANKSIIGNTHIAGNLNFNNSAVSTELDMSLYNVTIGGSVQNATLSTLTSTGTVWFISNNAPQTLGTANYYLNNINFGLNNPTATRTKTLNSNISFTGALNIMSFTGGSSSLFNQVNLQNFKLIGIGSGTSMTVNDFGSIQSSILQPDIFYENVYDINLYPQSNFTLNNVTNGSQQLLPPLRYGNVILAGPGGPGQFNLKLAHLGGANIRGNLTANNAAILVDGGYVHTLSGNWALGIANYSITGTTSGWLFDGSPQLIGPANNLGSAPTILPNITFSGSDITIQSTTNATPLSILGDVLFLPSANVNSTNKRIFIWGNWTQQNNGQFYQNGGQLIFSSPNANVQYVQTGSNPGYFNNFIIDRRGANTLVVANSNLLINGDLVLQNGVGPVSYATFDVSGRKITLNGHLEYQTNTSLLVDSLTGFVFGSNLTQTIYNGNTTPGAVFLTNVTFAGTGTKTLGAGAIAPGRGTYTNTHLYDGNIFIAPSVSALQGGNLPIQITGNWLNHAAPTVFTHANVITFLGTNQSITSTNFNSLVFANGGTKLLMGNLALNGFLTIATLTGLDVSASNYQLNISGAWTNHGTFNPRMGNVIFDGASATINTGTTTRQDGKHFYDLTISKAATQNATLNGGLDIRNNLTLANAGTLAAGNNNVYLLKNLYNNGGLYNQNSATAGIVLEPTVPGVYTFDGGVLATSVYGHITLNAPGSTYVLNNNLNISNNRVLNITNGTWSVVGKTMSMVGNAVNNVISITGGALEIGPGSQLLLGNSNAILNAGGTLRFLGTQSNPVYVGRNNTTGYIISQTGGLFASRYVVFQNLGYANTGIGSNGINISGGTIDGVNNFSNTSFLVGYSVANSFINLDGYAYPLGSITVSGAVFNDGPNFNVRSVSVPGANHILFKNSSGSRSGFGYEQDHGVQSATAGNIRWERVGKFWAGVSTIDGTDWHLAENWSDGVVPTANDTVYIDHSVIPFDTPYSVRIKSADAHAYRLVIDKQNITAAGIDMAIENSPYDLFVTESVNIYAGTTLAGFNADNTIALGGSWLNSGTYIPNNNTVIFNGSLLGTHVISQGTSAFHNLSFGGVGTTYLMSTSLSGNNIDITHGTLDVSASNYQIHCTGNWRESGAGYFNPRSGNLFFMGSGDQTINGTNFNNIITSTSGTKFIVSYPSINNLTIGANTTLNGANNLIYLTGNFTNNSTSDAYVQTGSGTLIFNATAGIQSILGNPTRFANITFNNPAQRTFGVTTSITGDFTINSNAGQTNVNATDVIGGASANLYHNGLAAIYITGSNHFPRNFNTYNLASNSTVEYRSDADQTIAGINYGNLILGTATAPSVTLSTKFAAGSFAVQGTGNSLIIGRNGADNNIVLNMANVDGSITSYGSYVHRTGAPQIIWGPNGTYHHLGGAWNIDTDITTFNNLILDGTGTKTLNNTLTIAGNLTMQNGINCNMVTFPILGTISKSFTLASGTTLQTQVPATSGVAFPSGFGTYTVDPTSTTTLNNATTNQLLAAQKYGTLNIFSGSTIPCVVTLAGNIHVEGNFTSNASATLVDDGYNMTFLGTMIIINNYPYPSSTSNVYFSGSDQYIRNTVSNASFLSLPNTHFRGTGVKYINYSTGCGGGCAYNANFMGNVDIASGVTVQTNRRIYFYGGLFNNQGTFNHIASGIDEFYATGSALQIINPGSSNTFRNFYAANTLSSINFTLNGGNFAEVFYINTLAGVHFGNGLTHRFQGSFFNGGPPALPSIVGDMTADGANFEMNGGGQVLPALTINNLTISGTGIKRLTAQINVNDLVINPGTALNTSSLDPAVSDNTISLSGSWLNSGTYVNNMSSVYMYGTGSAKNIMSNGLANNFVYLYIDPATTTNYLLQSPNTRVSRNMYLGPNATLSTLSRTLTLGSNTAAPKVFTISGVLDVNQNSNIEFNNLGSQCTMSVVGPNAHLKLVGLNFGNLASITRELPGAAAGLETRIFVDDQAKLSARYYNIEWLDYRGMYVGPTVTVDGVNNFSDGSFSNLPTGGPTPRTYLVMNGYLPGTIKGANFNYNVTPVIGTHYNVARTNTVTSPIVFDFPLGGALGAYNFENDVLNPSPDYATGTIIWPLTQTLTFTGALSSDWHNAANWNPSQIPTLNDNVIIPNVTNDPIISTDDAFCRDMIITNGQLNINGYNITIGGAMTLGTGANSAFLTFLTPNSMVVKGAWTKGVNGVFTHGNSTVTFDCNPGTYNINPGTSAFYNVNFRGTTVTYNLIGTLINVDGNMYIEDAKVEPNTANYTLNLSGNYLKEPTGTFSNGVANGTIALIGSSAQSITGATFFNLNVLGSGVKYFFGPDTVYNNLQISSTLSSDATGVLYVQNGSVTINASGNFEDGGQTHYFAGTNWTGLGSYTGTGSINFIRNGGQNIYQAKFNNLNLNGIGTVTLFGDVQLTGDLNIALNGGGNQVECNTFKFSNILNTGQMNVNPNMIIRLRGENNGPSGFAAYNFHPTSQTFYQRVGDQTVSGISYGQISFLNGVKTLGGDISVEGDLIINNLTTLDGNNYSINCAGNWQNNNGNSSFICRQGQVIFDAATNNQIISNNNSGIKDFYQIQINKTSGTVFVGGTAPFAILDNLFVLGGILNFQGYTVTVGGDAMVTGGNIATSGTLFLNQASGSASLQFNGSVLQNLTMNSGATYVLSDNLTVNNRLLINSGTLDVGSNIVTLGNNTHNIDGTFKLGPGGRLNTQGTFTVGNTGYFEALGTSSNIARISNNGARYNFVVNGRIAATYYLFENMQIAGVQINPSATIDGVNNLSYGTFTNNLAGGSLLSIENNQTMTIHGVSFPVNPGPSTYNVQKTASSGTITFHDASGVFSGPTFENDPGNIHINWTGPILFTWNGSVSNDWYDPANWTPSSGPATIPGLNDNVLIPFPTSPAGGAQPVIFTAGAKAKNITINNSASLTINTSSNTIDLTLDGDIVISGSLNQVSANDIIEVRGNWNRTGSYSPNGGVIFNAVGGTKSINHGISGQFGYLTFTGNATYLYASTNNIINGDIYITSGATLDASGVDITYRRSFINYGTYNAGTGVRVTNFAATTPSTYSIISNNAVFNIINISSAGSTYNISGYNLNLNRNLNLNGGTLNLNSMSLNLGDNVGTDIFTINTGATLNINANASLRMGAGAQLDVNGGTLIVVGTDSVNVANITRQTTGNYSISINSGTVQARYYFIEYTDAAGIQVNSLATLHSTNNFSDGVFSNGASSGSSRYLNLLCNLAGDITISGVTFNSGPTYNISRLSGTGNVIIFDSKGLLSNYFYEDDILAPGADDGKIRWLYSIPTLYWSGNVNTDWNVAGNWLPSMVPTTLTNVFIPDVSLASNTYPNLTGTGFARKLVVNPSARLTISGTNIEIAQEMSANAGSTVIVPPLATPTIKVGDQWDVLGAFSSGSSTVELTASTGTKVINNGTNQFYNLSINSSTGGGNFQINNSLVVRNNLSILSGKLNVGSSSYTLSIGGNWLNTGQFVSNGNNTIFYKVSGLQSISGANNVFGSVTFQSTSGTKTVLLASNITATGNVIINGTNCTFNAANYNVEVRGNWTNTARAFVSTGTGTAIFNGSLSQTINRSGGENFNNLIVSSPSTKLLSKDINIAGTLTLSNGVINTGVNKVNILSTGSVSGGSSSSYVNGFLQKHINTGTGIARTFEVGDGTGYQPVNITLPTVNTAGTMVLKVTNPDHPNIGSSCFNASRTVNKYWTVNGSGVAPVGYNATFNFTSAMYDAGSIPSNFEVGLYAAGTWSIQTPGTKTATSTQATSIYSYGDFQVGELASAYTLGVTVTSSINGPTCTGTGYTFTAVGTNAGPTPSYQWKRNGANVGTNSNIYVLTNAGNNDVISVVMTSSAPCYIGSTTTSAGVTLTVNPNIDNNTIASAQTVCQGTVPATLTGSNPTGGSGSYTYLWQSSTVNSTTGFVNAGGVNNQMGYAPSALSSTTWYRRIVSSGGCVATTSGLQITVDPAITNNTISGATTVCTGVESVTIVGSMPSGGTGVYSYQWEQSTLSGVAGYVTASGINNNQNYLNGPFTTNIYFRRIVSSGACSNTSTGVLINVSSAGIWYGGADNSWNNTANWCGNTLPTINTDAIIRGTALNMPIVGMSGAMINNLQIDAGATLSISGSNVMSIAGNFMNNGTFVANTGNVIMQGAGNQSISGVNTFYDLTISKTTTTVGVILGNGQRLFGSLTLSPNSHINFSGHVLTIASNANYTGRIAEVPSSAVISGNVRVERYIPAKITNRFMASPVTGATFQHYQNFGINTPGQGILITGNGAGSDPGSVAPTVVYYVESFPGVQATGFQKISGTSTPITAGTGYRVLIRGDRTLNITFAGGYTPTPTTLAVTGTPIIGDFSLPLSYTPTYGGTSADGWNFVGNPYASAIDWDLVVANSGLTNVENAFYVQDPGSGTTSLGCYFNYVGGVYSGCTFSGVTNPSVIASSQAFFVKATTTSSSIVFKENMKTGAAHSPRFRQEEIRNMIRIAVKNSMYEDNTVIRFKDDANVGFDNEYDAHKFNNSTINISSTPVPGENLSINTMPQIENDGYNVPLNISSAQTGVHQLYFSNLQSFDNHIAIYLIDKYLNIAVQITNNYTYTFNVTTAAGSSPLTRFEVTFTPQFGLVKVSIGPDSLPSNASWQIDGVGNYASGTTLSQIPVGSHTITFGAVQGWTSPSQVTINVAHGDTTKIQAAYTALPKYGTLLVNTTPRSLYNGRVKTYFSVNGGAYQPSGTSVTNLLPGVYTVNFGELSGYTKPLATTVYVPHSTTTTVLGVYNIIEVAVDTTLSHELIEVQLPGDGIKQPSIAVNTSLMPESIDDDLVLYPNPAKSMDEVKLCFGKRYGKLHKVEIYHAGGGKVTQKDVDKYVNAIKLDFGKNLPAGMYIVKIYTEAGVFDKTLAIGL